MKSDVVKRIKHCSELLGIETQKHINEYSLSDIRFDQQLLENDCVLFCNDNLGVLYFLNQEGFRSVDFCYIDPPYNTKNAFIYDDSRVGNKLLRFGSHSAWMSFMLPRLIWAHELIANNGIIAVSIDDYEQPFIRFLLDAVFGEDNFLGNIVVCRSKNGKGSKKNIAVNHEYVVVYGKSGNSKILGLPDDISNYNKEDQYGSFRIDGLFRKKGDASRKEDRPNMFFPLYFNENGEVFTENHNNKLKKAWPIDSKGIERRWLWGQEKTKNESWKLYASPKGTVYVKNYSSSKKRIKIRSIWDNNRYLTERGTNQIKEIFGEKVFETPKPIELIEDLILSQTKNDALILDFFAGTGTTAHAAYNLNIRDNGTRKVLLIEQKAEIPSNHIARKMGFNIISEITEKRLEYISKLDNSFKYSVVS